MAKCHKKTLVQFISYGEQITEIFLVVMKQGQHGKNKRQQEEGDFSVRITQSLNKEQSRKRRHNYL